METIAAPIPPTGPTAPSGPQEHKAPDIGKAPAAMPPVVDRNDADDDPFSAEKVANLQEKIPDKSKDRPEVKTPKPEDKGKPVVPDVKKEVKPEDKKADAKSDAPKVDETTKAGKITGWQMARKHEATIKELNAKLTESAKTQPAAAKPAELKIDEHPEYKGLAEKFTKAEARRTQLEDEIRWHNYEQSEEYQTKYLAPYQNAYKEAVHDVSSFRVNLEDGQSRAATREDFDRVLFAKDPASAIADAEKLFGATAANYIVSLRNDVIKASSAAHQAKDEFRTKGAVELKSRAEKQEKEQTARAETFHRHVAEATEKNPQWFKESDGDDEGNAMLKRGYMLADASFGGHILDPETKQMREPTPDEIVQLNAMLRNKAGAFDRVVHRHQAETKTLNERIAELEAELSDYRESEPGAGKGTEKKGKDDGEDDPFAKYG